MSPRYLSVAVARLVLAVGLLSATPARASVDIDFGAAVRIGDHSDIFFAVSSRYFDQDRAVVETWGRRCDNPDDLAVALFISNRSGRSLDWIFALRASGRSWWDIGVRVGIPVDAWFVPVARDPGPPYGKAYGYWKKHRRDPRAVVRLTDGDVRNLVAVRVIHEYYGAPVDVAMQWRASGRNLPALVSEEYHRRHGKSGSPPGQSGKGKPASPRYGPGHSKGHGKNL
jgi:hypothetical protein